MKQQAKRSPARRWPATGQLVAGCLLQEAGATPSGQASGGVWGVGTPWLAPLCPPHPRDVALALEGSWRAR